AQSGHRHLVQQRLEEMMVRPVYDRDLDAAHIPQSLRRVHPGESAPHDQDFLVSRHGSIRESSAYQSGAEVSPYLPNRGRNDAHWQSEAQARQSRFGWLRGGTPAIDFRPVSA